MIKKVLKFILGIIALVFTYILQIYVFNKVEFFGVTADLSLMYVVLVTMKSKTYLAYINAVLCGVLSDFLFSYVPLKYIVVYILCVTLLLSLRKIYNEESKVAILIYGALATVVCQIILLLFNLLSSFYIINPFIVIFSILKQSIINIFLIFVLYILLHKLYAAKEN